MIDCTIRNLPENVEAGLRAEARRRDLSLEQTALELLAQALGLENVDFEYYDLEPLEAVQESDGSTA